MIGAALEITFTERQELELERQNAIFTIHFDRQQKSICTKHEVVVSIFNFL